MIVNFYITDNQAHSVLLSKLDSLYSIEHPIHSIESII